MLRAPKVGNPINVYIAAQEQVIRAVLLQEEDGKEFPVAYVIWVGKALEEIEKGMVKIAKAYNKCVMEKSFQLGDMVWKTILPLRTRSGKFGKWSPSWEGPFRVI
jgi:hypothetical protein